MPTYLITAPDGRQFNVSGEGTQEEALAHFQSQYGAQPEPTRDDRIAALKKQNPGEYDPTSPEWQAKYGPTSGMSKASEVAAAAGKSLVDMGRGAKQIGLEMADWFRSPQTSDLIQGTPAQRYRQEIDASEKLDAPLMQTGAGKAGYVAGSLATTLLPAGAIAKGAQALKLGRTAAAAKAFVSPTTYKAAIGAGALQGALQPVGTDQSRLQNTAIGAGAGIIGNAALNTIGRIAQPIMNKLTPQTQKAVQTLDAAGVPLDTAQRTGSGSAEIAKRAVSDNPITASGQAEFQALQKQKFTQAAIKLMGEDAPVATEDVMAKASNRIGNVMDEIAKRNPVTLDKPLTSSLDEIERAAQGELDDAQFGVIKKQIDAIRGKADREAAQQATRKHAVTVEADDQTGAVTAKTSGGETYAQENGQYLQGKRNDTATEAQKQGQSTARYEQLFKEAQQRGLTLASDFSVSPSQVAQYKKLEKLGYTLKQNPSEVNQATGNLIAKDPRVPVFEVTAGPNSTAMSRSGALDGKAYQNIRTTLGRLSIGADQQKGHYARQLRDMLDEALQRSAQGDDAIRLKEARTQYQRMLQIEKAIAPDGSGLISPAKLANSMAAGRAGSKLMKYGKGDQQLAMLARAGKQLLPDKFPNSGTTARAAAQLLAPAAIGTAAGVASGNTEAGLGTAAGTAALLFGARGALNNQLLSRYLSEGMQGPARNMLLAPQRAGMLRHVPIAAALQQ